MTQASTQSSTLEGSDRPLLNISGLNVYYGESHILRNVDMSVRPGEMVCLIGRNGVGKTTLLKTLIGLLKPRTGSIQFMGESLAKKTPDQRARLGIGYVPERRDVFPDLTVAQNLLLGQKPGQSAGRWSVADIFGLFPQLQLRYAVAAGVLSGGEQQMLALCRTLMGDPDLIVIDEPTEGLAPLLVEAVANFLVTLKTNGVSVLLIEQKLTVALQVADRCAVMGHGQVVWTSSPAEMQGNAPLQQEWLQV